MATVKLTPDERAALAASLQAHVDVINAAPRVPISEPDLRSRQAAVRDINIALDADDRLS